MKIGDQYMMFVTVDVSNTRVISATNRSFGDEMLIE